MWTVLVAAAFLVSQVSGSAWNLYDYKLCKKVRLEGINGNASGATYNPVTGTLWVVTNQPKQLSEYSVDGHLLREIPWSGFNDPEGLTWISDTKLGVLEEPFEGGISVVDISPEVTHVMQDRMDVRIQVESNNGLEGLAYDPLRDTFFVVQEMNPKRVLEIFPDGEYKVLFDSEHMGVGDLSGLHFVPSLDQFFILSQESKAVLRVTRNGFVLQGIPVDGNYPEGLAFSRHGEKMFVVSEPNELSLYSSTESCSESI